MADKNMSMEERGRKGGEATAEKHDKEFYQEIGQKGGEATAENHDKEFYQEIGRKGGEATAENHDREFYQEIGQKGEERISRLARGNRRTLRPGRSHGDQTHSGHCTSRGR